MKTSVRLLAAASLAALLALTSGCDKSDPTAPDSSTIVLDANPTSLVLDDDVTTKEPEVGRSTIIATVLDADGGPLSGFVVHFSTNSGSLRSGGGGVKTNSDGEARDVLTLHSDDADATVTARAKGAGSQTTSVSVTGPGENRPPSGTIDQPSSNQAIIPGGSVTFAGSGTDPDPTDTVTFTWTFEGGTPGTSTAEDPGAVTFSTAGTFTVTLTVRDNHGLPDPSPATRVITVAAANQAPDGTISSPAGDQNINAGGSVSFAGSGTDPDGDTPLTYLWDFGGGATNSTQQNPGAVTFSTTGTFTVTFTVRDSRGLADPSPPTRAVTVN